MNKLYDMIIWNNNTTPALNEDNLNAMSQAINDIDDRVVALGSDVLTVIPQIQAYLDQAEDLVAAMEALSQNPPYIGANGNWWVWDTETEQFVDSEIDASITVTIADVTAIAPDATPYITNTGTNTDPVFHLFIPRGQTGAAGQDGDDGVSPDVEITTITGGHRVTITDAEHPSGQSFDVMNGTGGGDISASDLAPAFSDQTAYAVGEYVSYQGAIYKCTTSHSAGAWDSTHFTLAYIAVDLEYKVNGNETGLLIDPSYSNSGLLKKSDGHIVAKWYDSGSNWNSLSNWKYQYVYYKYQDSSGVHTNSTPVSPYWKKQSNISFTANTIVSITETAFSERTNYTMPMYNVYASKGNIRLIDMSESNGTLTIRLLSPVTQTADVYITAGSYYCTNI